MTARLDDWETLSVAWRAAPVEHPLGIDTLRRTVHRRQRELIAVLAAEVAITLLVVGLTVRLLRGGFNRATGTGAALVLLWTATVWAFTIWNRRGTWRPLAATTKEYLRLSRQRIVAGGRTVTFVRASVSVYAIAYGGWFITRVTWQTQAREAQMIWLFAVAYCSLLLAWSVWYARRLKVDLQRTESIERSLDLSQVA